VLDSITLQTLGVPAVCVVSDQFAGLAAALLGRPGASGQLDSPPAVVIVPYPVSGIDAEAVVAKALAAVPEAAAAIAAKIGAAGQRPPAPGQEGAQPEG
jgi:hypothetical protein